jgi:hypothetical protein
VCVGGPAIQREARELDAKHGFDFERVAWNERVEVHGQGRPERPRHWQRGRRKRGERGGQRFDPRGVREHDDSGDADPGRNWIRLDQHRLERHGRDRAGWRRPVHERRRFCEQGAQARRLDRGG